jgi:hypothetical protein
MPSKSPQDDYSENLEPAALGIALYRPPLFVLEERRNKVGDIGYFDSLGKWKVIGNAFDQEVK